MKKTYLEKMGLKPVRKLTKKICQSRVSLLRSRLKRGVFKGELRDQAVYYANWYEWLRKRGGTRAL
jgi:hypothetical protein